MLHTTTTFWTTTQRTGRTTSTNTSNQSQSPQGVLHDGAFSTQLTYRSAAASFLRYNRISFPTLRFESVVLSTPPYTTTQPFSLTTIAVSTTTPPPYSFQSPFQSQSQTQTTQPTSFPNSSFYTTPLTIPLANSNSNHVFTTPIMNTTHYAPPYPPPPPYSFATATTSSPTYNYPYSTPLHH